jgi:hypothetical protein
MNIFRVSSFISMKKIFEFINTFVDFVKAWQNLYVKYEQAMGYAAKSYETLR